jgi:hypothetical protein
MQLVRRRPGSRCGEFPPRPPQMQSGTPQRRVVWESLFRSSDPEEEMIRWCAETPGAYRLRLETRGYAAQLAELGSEALLLEIE